MHCSLIVRWNSRLMVGLVGILASAAQAEVVMDWVTIGAPGNSGDPQETCTGCTIGTTFGSVGYAYRIGKYEVTNAQYAEFLNAVASNDTNDLYNPSMGTAGITKTGSSYSPIAGREDWPVNYVSFWDAARFANWMHNGQPTGAQNDSTTETGAYTLTTTSILNNTVTRNGGASVFVTSEDEWYKGAYYNANAMSYFDYPAGSDTQISCTGPGPTANTANCAYANPERTDVGSYTGAPSPSGTFDQGGNVLEWNDAMVAGSYRGGRGGDYSAGATPNAASVRSSYLPGAEGSDLGFRLTSPVPAPPVPSLGALGAALLFTLLVGAGSLGLALRRI